MSNLLFQFWKQSLEIEAVEVGYSCRRKAEFIEMLRDSEALRPTPAPRQPRPIPAPRLPRQIPIPPPRPPDSPLLDLDQIDQDK